MASDRAIVCMSLRMKIMIDMAGPKSSMRFVISSCMFRIFVLVSAQQLPTLGVRVP